MWIKIIHWHVWRLAMLFVQSTARWGLLATDCSATSPLLFLILVLSFSDLYRKAAFSSYNRRSKTKEFPLMYSWWNQCCIQAPYLPVVVHELLNSWAAAAVLLNYFSLIADFSAMKQWASASFKLLWQWFFSNAPRTLYTVPALYKKSLYKKIRGWICFQRRCFVECIWTWELRNWGTLVFKPKN